MAWMRKYTKWSVIRAIRKKRTIPPTAFECRDWEDCLSVHEMAGEWPEERLRAYAGVLDSGDSPGVLDITDQEFVEAGIPVPTIDVDEDDEEFGHLHCCTDCPTLKQQEALSKALKAAQEDNRIPLLDFQSAS